MIRWVDESYKYKGYRVGQNIIYKLSNSDDEYLEGKIIGFNLSDDAIFPVYIQSKRYGVSFKERKSFIERNNCVFYNGIDTDSCMFNNITFKNIKTKIMDGDNMFRNAKVGDRVWHIRKGWAVIAYIDKSSTFSINVRFKDGMSTSFTIDGKEYSADINPTLFWDEIEVSAQEKPFSLEEELRKLKIVKFDGGNNNCYLCWDNCRGRIKYCNSYWDEFVNYKFFSESSINNFLDNIKDKKITKEQFFSAYKKVFGGI